MFRDRRDAFSGASFIADYYSSSEAGKVSYVGVWGVQLGIFVVDVGGEPRVVVGPVTDAFEHTGAIEKRLTDSDARHLSEKQRVDPWSASYRVPGSAAPPLTCVVTKSKEGKETFTQSLTFEVWSTRALGPVTLELLDHHRRVLASVTHDVSKAKTKFQFASQAIKDPDSIGYEGVHVHTKGFDAWELDAVADPQSGAPRSAIGEGYGMAYGGMPAIVRPPSPDEASLTK
jgi:hypothetical protein